MAYDPDHDVAYIAQSSRIQIFDCYNNTFPYDPLLISNCIKIFYGENQKLYVLRKVFDSPNIYKMMIFDTQDFPTIDLIDELTVCQSTGILNDANFYYNDHLNDPEVYCSIFDMEESYGYFAAIDATYDVLITNPSIQIARPSKMEYNSIDTLIYFKCSDYSVGVLDRSDWQLNTVNTGAIFYDIAYSEHTNTLYLTCNDGKIRFIKGKNLLQTDLYITDLPVTLLYDNVNNRMFIHAYTVQTIDDNPFQLEEELFVYDELNQNLLNIGFDNMEKRMAYQSQIGLDVPDHDIIYNPDDEIVYLADGHSVLNVVDMKETCAQEDYDNYVIDDSETWMDDKYISRYIVIEDGGSLEIESTSTVHLMTNAKITVKPGGELIVNGGKLTSACEGYWWGIELQGNREENQFDRSNQGYLELQHHATIEYSVNGILAAGTRFPLALDLTRTGGIINSDSAIFHNNLRCVDIEAYTNHHPYNGDPWSNLSNFTACEFINDRDNPYENYHLNEMIHLSEIQGITFYGCAFELSDHLAEASSIYNQLVRLDNCENMIFKGCTFHNYLPDHLCDADKRGVAIASYNSGVTVNYICTAWGLQDCVEWIPSEFDGFSWAIVASDEGLNFPVAIDKVEFINNLRGIYLSGLTDPQITSNDFDMYTDFDVADHQTYLYGLYLEGCPTYHVEANHFSSYMAYDSTFGTVIRGCGPLANEIYSNTYDSLDIGIEAIGYNRGPNDGLCIKCNDFIYNKMDIYVGGYTPGPAYGHGMPCSRASLPDRWILIQENPHVIPSLILPVINMIWITNSIQLCMCTME